MKRKFAKKSVALTLGLALVHAPLVAIADHCSSGKDRGKNHPGMGYYGHPGMGYSGHPGMSKAGHPGMRFIQPVYTVPSVQTGYQQMYHQTSSHGNKANPSTADIVDTASQAGSFETLISALEAAGLDEVLRGEGPFTVFAPSDEAFAKIPEDQLTALIADKQALAEVLKYHVVAGNVSSEQVVKLTSAKTVQGSTVAIDTTDGVRINGAKVVKADIPASNGVIHVIDTVIMPN